MNHLPALDTDREVALTILELGPPAPSPAAFLGLDQELSGDAAAAVFFLADLSRVLGRFGNRGYRAVTSKLVSWEARYILVLTPSAWALRG